MDDVTKAKLIAAGKIAMGAGRMASAIVTATGHGLIGVACRQNHLMTTAVRIAAQGGASGRRQFDEGVADWKKTSR